MRMTQLLEYYIQCISGIIIQTVLTAYCSMHLSNHNITMTKSPHKTPALLGIVLTLFFCYTWYIHSWKVQSDLLKNCCAITDDWCEPDSNGQFLLSNIIQQKYSRSDGGFHKHHWGKVNFPAFSHSRRVCTTATASYWRLEMGWKSRKCIYVRCLWRPISTQDIILMTRTNLLIDETLWIFIFLGRHWVRRRTIAGRCCGVWAFTVTMRWWRAKRWTCHRISCGCWWRP